MHQSEPECQGTASHYQSRTNSATLLVVVDFGDLAPAKAETQHSLQVLILIHQICILVIVLFMEVLVARKIHRVLAAPALLVDPTPRVSYR